jgi:hypothetical protein
LTKIKDGHVWQLRMTWEEEVDSLFADSFKWEKQFKEFFIDLASSGDKTSQIEI